VAVWTGTFPGQSVTDAGKGVMHFAAWDCTGENVHLSGKVAWGGGLCSVSHPIRESGVPVPPAV
jgi:hypothetical protein